MGELVNRFEAAAILAVSISTFKRICSAGEGPRVTTRPRHGNRPESLYDRAECEAIRDKRQKHQTQVMRPDDARLAVGSPVGPVDPLSQPLDLGRGLKFIAWGLRAGLRDIAQALKPPDPDPCLTLEMAAKYKGIPAGLMLRFIQAKKLPAVKYGRWLVRRSAVDNLNVEAALGDVRKATEELRAAVARKAAGE